MKRVFYANRQHNLIVYSIKHLPSNCRLFACNSPIISPFISPVRTNKTKTREEFQKLYSAVSISIIEVVLVLMAFLLLLWFNGHAFTGQTRRKKKHTEEFLLSSCNKQGPSQQQRLVNIIFEHVQKNKTTELTTDHLCLICEINNSANIFKLRLKRALTPETCAAQDTTVLV